MASNYSIMQTIGNNILTIEVSEHGAELQSIKKGSVEYLWQGDPTYWGRRSPVLFPIVGSVWEKRYRVDGKEYELGQHGFARDMEFQLVSHSETEVRYRLESTASTLDKYPYPFVLDVAYRLHENKLDVIWDVINPASEDMYFQIGAHPAFNYPDYSLESSQRGFLSFGRGGQLQCIRIKEKGCVDAEKIYLLEIPADGLLPIASDTFDVIDTLMVQDSQIDQVAMYRVDGSPWLKMTFDAPVVGIWSPPGKVAPFICLEPWYGRCDRAGYEGEFKDRDWMNRLSPGESFHSEYTVEIC